jgi:hypothetical protein
MTLCNTTGKTLAAIAGWCAVVFAAGCGGGHGGSSPSEPFIQARITTSLTSVGAPAILEARLFFDGQLVQDQTVSTAAGTVQFDGMGTLAAANLAQNCSGDATEPDLGPHTLDLTIVRQTASPSNYVASSPQLLVTTAGRVQTTLSGESGALATGQSFHWSFCL